MNLLLGIAERLAGLFIAVSAIPMLLLGVPGGMRGLVRFFKAKTM